MRENAVFALTDVHEVKRLVRENPWVTIVSATGDGVVGSHYPVVLDEESAADEIVLLSHVGRPDERLHGLGEREVLVVVQGPHGYISPSWYDEEVAVPTWNFITAHLYGVPEILDDAENLRVLEKLVDHFEDPMPEPRRMNGTLENAAYAQRIVAGTVGFRLRVTRFTAKVKMSQNRLPGTQERVLEELESGTTVYRSEALAREMRLARGLEAEE